MVSAPSSFRYTKVNANRSKAVGFRLAIGDLMGRNTQCLSRPYPSLSLRVTDAEEGHSQMVGDSILCAHAQGPRGCFVNRTPLPPPVSFFDVVSFLKKHQSASAGCNNAVYRLLEITILPKSDSLIHFEVSNMLDVVRIL